MDLLDPNKPLNVWDPAWKIYTRTAGRPPHRIAQRAKVQNSMVTEGCNVEGKLDSAVLFAGVVIEHDAVVRDSILMPGAIVRSGAQVNYAIIAEDVEIGKGAIIGARPEHMDDVDKWGVTVVAEGVRIGTGVKVPAKAMVEKDILEVSDA